MEGRDSESANKIIEELMDEQGLSEREKREIMSDPESRKMIFWNSYERESIPASHLL
jgi:hypothetical protein